MNFPKTPRIDQTYKNNYTWKKPHSLQADWSFPISSSSTMSFLISMVGIRRDSSTKTSSDWSSGRRYQSGISPELLEARACTFATGSEPPSSLLISSPTIFVYSWCHYLFASFLQLFPFRLFVPFFPIFF